MKTKLFLFSLFLFCCLNLFSAPGLAAVPIPKGLGVCIHSVAPQELDMVKAAGFTIARTDLKWNEVERVRGQYDWTAADNIVNSLISRGIRPYLILDYNNFSYGAPTELTGISNPDQVNGYVNFSKAAVARYKGKGIIWEIWNEPNLAQFWGPVENVTAYMNLLKTVVPAIKAVDANAIVVAPAVAFVGNTFSFLDVCGQQGLYGLVDAVSVHPYQNANPENGGLDYLYDTIRAQIRKYNPANPNLPIIGGEHGFTTVWSNIKNETTQAQYNVRQILYHDYKNIPISMIYDFKNDGTDPNYTEHNFGTVRADLSIKPAYTEIQKLSQNLAGMNFSGRLASAASDYIYEYTNASGAKTAAAWTTGAAHTVTIYGQSVNLTGMPVYVKNATVTQPPAPTVTLPASPSNIKVTSVTKGATTGSYFVNLSWTDNSNNEVSFEVQQSINSVTNFQPVATVAQNGTTASINIGTAPTQGTYYYQVLAVNTAGKSQPSNVVNTNISTATTTPPPVSGAPAAPSGLKVTSQPYYAAGNYWVNLGWTDNSNNETGFQVQQSIGSNTNYKIIATPAVNNTNISIGLGSNPVSGTYYFRLLAVNASGVSQPSNEVSAVVSTTPTTTPPPTPALAPSNLTAKIGVTLSTGAYSAVLNWTDNSDNETGYDIYQSVSNKNDFKLVGSVGAFVGTGNVNNTSSIGVNPTFGTYYYKVTAKFADGSTKDSNIVNADVKDYIPPLPTGLTTMNVRTTDNKPAAILSWKDNSLNESGFNVYYASSESGPFYKAGVTSSNTTMVVHPLVDAGTYYYKITAFNSTGESGTCTVVPVVIN